jgi:hypothetical protein
MLNMIMVYFILTSFYKPSADYCEKISTL